MIAELVELVKEVMRTGLALFAALFFTLGLATGLFIAAVYLWWVDWREERKSNGVGN